MIYCLIIARIKEVKMLFSTYDITKSYDDNYESGPVVNFELPKLITSKPIKLWGYSIASPIGVPAGPLLNAKYIELYAKLGFDLPVYKTVRSTARNAHAWPNCLYIDSSRQLSASNIGNIIHPSNKQPLEFRDIAITNSFGIPSKEVEIWQADIEKSNASLSHNQLMIVSCVGTPLEDKNILDDFCLTAKLAIEAGAKAIELNFSCPNVASKEGSIFHDSVLSSKISKAVKRVIKDIPLMIKIGYIENEKLLEDVIVNNAPYVDGIAAINTISMQVQDKNGDQSLPGKERLKSGICGSIIKDISLGMVKRIINIKRKNNYDFIVCGVGGVVSTHDIDHYLECGVDIVMSATGAMWNPYLAHDWKKLQIQL